MYKSLSTEFLGFETDAETTIRLARDCGFEGVDLGQYQALGVMRDGTALEVHRQLEEAGIRAGCFPFNPRNVAGNEADWKRDIDTLPRLCDSMRSAGFTRAYTVIIPFDEKLDYDANFDRHGSRIRQVRDILLSFEIRLGLEYISPLTRRIGNRYPFIHDMAGAHTLSKAVGSPNPGLLLDCFHWYCAGEGESDIQALAPEQIVGVHINDAVPGRTVEEQVAFERRLPGSSKMIDIHSFLQGLESIGYDGPVACEPMCKELADLPMPVAAAKVRHAMEAVLSNS